MAVTLLPALTGPYAVGNRRLFLSDPSRVDPFSGAAARLVSVTAWYPTAGAGPAARYLSNTDSLDATMALEITNRLEGRTCYNWIGGTPMCFGVSVANTIHPRIRARDTRAAKDAPIRTDLGLLPTVVYSPGLGVPGNHGSILAQELASHGYLVFTLSHTWESVVTELASNVAVQNTAAVNNQIPKCLDARVGDVRYLLDQMPVLPYGLAVAYDAARIAIVGHSLGGLTALEVAALEPARVTAAAVLDGLAGYPGTSNRAQDNGLQQAVMLLSGPILDDGILTGAEDQSWATYQTRPHGPLHIYTVDGAKHHAFTDVGLLSTRTADACGTITPARAMALHPRWTRAFLDTYVRDIPDTLLGGSPDWPEVHVVV